MADGGPERTEIIMAEHRITRAQARRLFQDDLSALGEAASSVRFRKHPDKVVTYSIQRVINYTNICNAYCSFCSFYRAPGHPEGYLLSNDEIFRKIEDGIERGVTGVLIQGGDHPELTVEYYEALLRNIKRRFRVDCHSFSASEITNLARVSGITVEAAIARLRDAGLDSIPGAGAEILDDEIRERVSPMKIKTGEWLAVHRAAHRLELPTGVVRVEHRTRREDIVAEHQP